MFLERLDVPAKCRFVAYVGSVEGRRVGGAWAVAERDDAARGFVVEVRLVVGESVGGGTGLLDSKIWNWEVRSQCCRS